MLATYKKVSTNKSKWQNKLKEDKPKWRQFICPDNFNSQLCKNYDIDAIPRFLFFDKDGRILSLNAPRPSLLTSASSNISTKISNNNQSRLALKKTSLSY